MFMSVCLYLGILALLVGCAIFILPLGRWKLTRLRGFVVALVGLGLAALMVAWPAPEARPAPPGSRALNTFVPRYQFDEVHGIDIAASPDRAWDAILAVTAPEIRLFDTLTWLRRFGRPAPEGILNVPPRQPILTVATRTTFITLAQSAPREIVVGTVVIAPLSRRMTGHRLTSDEFVQWQREPGIAVAAMDFHVEPSGSGSRVTTETRVFATDDETSRQFAGYWRAIYPGSALIRRSWLRAIKTRAEAPESASTP